MSDYCAGAITSDRFAIMKPCPSPGAKHLRTSIPKPCLGGEERPSRDWRNGTSPCRYCKPNWVSWRREVVGTMCFSRFAIRASRFALDVEAQEVVSKTGCDGCRWKRGPL